MQQLIVCYRCGQHNIPGGRFCQYCGTPIVTSCPNCRSVVYPGAQACGYCGIRLSWSQQQPAANATNATWCPNCRSVVYPGYERCGNCGMPLNWNQHQPAANAANAAWCPNCRSAVYPGAERCGNCGLRLDWSQWQRAGEGARTTETAKGMKAEKAATAIVKKPAGKKSTNIVSWLATAVLVVVVLFLAFVYISPEYDMFLVKSESMVPAINMGDLIITGPVNGTVRPGTVVTYARGEVLVTHRVISIKDKKLVTKGDAVEDPDPGSITMSQVRGIYLFKIPSLGYLANFMHTKLGWFIVVIVPSILLLGLIFYEIAKEVLKKPQRRLYTESYTQRR